MNNSRFKFRVWDEEKKEWCNKCLMQDFIDIHTVCFDDYIELVSNRLYKIAQSTGLYDCDGEEVFEGDIVRYQTYLDEGIALIAWHSNLACYKLQVNKGDNLCHMINYPVSDWRYKVIGNRFTNPELLEAQK